MLGLHCWVGSSLAGASGGCSVDVCGLLTLVASPVVEHGLWGVWASVAAARGPAVVPSGL